MKKRKHTQYLYELKTIREIEAESYEILDAMAKYVHHHGLTELTDMTVTQVAEEIDKIVSEIDRRYIVKTIGKDELVVYLPPSCCLLSGSKQYIMPFDGGCYIEISPRSQIHVIGESGKEVFDSLMLIMGSYYACDCADLIYGVHRPVA